MYIFLIVLLLILLILCTILFLPTRLILDYDLKTLTLSVRILFFRFTVKREIMSAEGKKGKKQKKEKKPSTKDEKNSYSSADETPEGFLDKIHSLKEKYYSIRELVDTFLEATKYKISLSEIYINIHYGSGNATATGMLYGAFWGLIGNLYSFLCRFFYMDFPKTELKPDFNNKVFNLRIEGIISLRLVHIINALIKTYRVYRRQNKNRNK